MILFIVISRLCVTHKQSHTKCIFICHCHCFIACYESGKQHFSTPRSHFNWIHVDHSILWVIFVWFIFVAFSVQSYEHSIWTVEIFNWSLRLTFSWLCFQSIDSVAFNSAYKILTFLFCFCFLRSYAGNHNDRRQVGETIFTKFPRWLEPKAGCIKTKAWRCFTVSISL